MAGFWTAAAIVAAAAVTAGASMYSADRQKKAAREAADRQLQQAQQAEHQRNVDFKRQNQNEVDVSGLLKGNQGGQLASTMLTGAGGVDPTQLMLGGKNKLLGG